MSIADQLAEWVKNETEAPLLEWLKQATEKERRELVPPIKKLDKYYSEFISTDNRSYSSRGTTKQHDLLNLASYTCFSKADYLKLQRATWIIDPEHLDKVKDWYHPDWFSELLNKEAESEFMVYSLNYSLVWQLFDQGLLQPSNRLWARTLSTYIFQDKGIKNKWVFEFKPEKLLERPETLDQHIWYFFEEETELHLAGRYNHYGENADLSKIGWIPALTRMVTEVRLDRERLLRESLLASNKNYNKNLSGWHMDLFSAQFPTVAELIQLQPILVSVLNSPHSKVVNEALQFLKTIATEKNFDSPSLLDAAPVFLSSKTKTTVASGLMLLEQIAKKHPDTQKAIALIATQALVHADDGLQARAAKLISRFGEVADPGMPDRLAPYRDGLLQTARELLGPFLQAVEMDSTVRPDHPLALPDEPNKKIPVQTVSNTDELIFLSAQAFDNNDALHIDLLPSALVTLLPALKGELLSQFQPALQRALQLTRNNFRSNEGYYDHMLGIFFIDVCIHLARKYPEESKPLTDVFEKFSQKEGDTEKKWMNIGANDNYISTWTNYYKDPYYLPRKQWLMDVLQKIRAGDTTPLLSTPTHYPGYIDPQVLVERIAHYEKEKQLADKTDLLMALGRVDLQDTAAALQLAREKLSGEWRSLMVFLFTPDAAPDGDITQGEAWISAALSKSPKKTYQALLPFGFDEYYLKKFTGQLAWKTIIEEFERDEWKWENEKAKTIKVKDQRKIIRIDFSGAPVPKENSGMKGLLEKLKWKQKEKKQAGTPLLYDYYEIKSEFFSNEHNDLRRALLMASNNLEAFLPTLIDRCMSRPASIGEGDKKMTLAALQLLYETWQEQGEMAHLFLATALLSADKTAAQTAAEIWLSHAPGGKLDVSLTGKIIGIHERVEFAPLKRFNDLAVQSLFRVSAQHNRLLETMIGSIIAELPAEPIKHLKKLLELYKELFLLNQTGKIPDAVKVKLHEWKPISGLAKLVEGFGV